MFRKSDKAVSKMNMNNLLNNTSLANCPACQTAVSRQAVSCPRCGQPLQTTNYQPQQFQQNFSQPVSKKGGVGKTFGVGCLGLIGFLVVAGLIGSIALPKPNTIQNQTSSSPTNLVSESKIDVKSPEYQEGSQKGFQEGKSWAKEVIGSNGMPYPAAIKGMAASLAENSKSKDKVAWQSGWEDGFVKGYRSIKPSKIKTDDFEPLSWNNAKPNVKLYNNEGNLKVTIVAVKRSEGLITVKYGKEGNFAVEDKSLDALSELWFVKISESTQN